MPKTTVTIATAINTVLRALGVEPRYRGDADPDTLDDVAGAAATLANLAYETLYAGVDANAVNAARVRILAAMLAANPVKTRRRTRR